MDQKISNTKIEFYERKKRAFSKRPYTEKIEKMETLYKKALAFVRTKVRH